VIVCPACTFTSKVNGSTFPPGKTDLDLMTSSLEIDVLIRAVKVVDDADVIPVDEYLGIERRALNSHATIRLARAHADISGRR
jgi:hypothetical protein